MLTAFGPFVTDFYLPVLPDMSEFFHTSPALASLSLTTGMIGLAAGQVFIGPLTDKFGRKKILVGSMLMFAIASVLCIIAPNIYIFNLMRIFQGLAGAGGIVISKSMSMDMFSGKAYLDCCLPVPSSVHQASWQELSPVLSWLWEPLRWHRASSWYWVPSSASCSPWHCARGWGKKDKNLFSLLSSPYPSR